MIGRFLMSMVDLPSSRHLDRVQGLAASVCRRSSSGADQPALTPPGIRAAFQELKGCAQSGFRRRGNSGQLQEVPQQTTF